MEFKIDPEIYLRLAAVSVQPDEEHKAVARSVRIEHHNGKIIAIASNGKFLCGELLGECDDEGAVNVTNDPELRKIAEAEVAASGVLLISQVAGWTVARGGETGKMYALNAEVEGEYPDWRALVPTTKPTKPNGVIAFFPYVMKRIADASPSGVIVFPEVIDITQPVLIRDKTDPNWFGLYLLTDAPNKQTFKAATVPDWLRE